MTNIVILGAGVMGSALAVPASATNAVSLIGSPLDTDIIKSIRQTRLHPDLNIKLPSSVNALTCTEVTDAILESADVLILGVSSKGMDWALEKINHHGAHPNLLALVTKGLIPGLSETEPPRTYAQHIGSRYTVPEGRIVGIGGPCIARELGLKYPTHVSFAAANISAANALRDHLQTEYYRVSTHTNFTSLEACAALKNFLCIGVSAMFTAHSLDNSYAKNPLAALFNQAVHELASLSQWIVDAAHPVSNECHNVATSIHSHSAFGLAGMGDLHVTVGGGRNSLLGRYLGQGCQLSEVMGGDMQGVTVEGVDTGRTLLPGFRSACQSGVLPQKQFPLTTAILDAIEFDTPFDFNFISLPD